MEKTERKTYKSTHKYSKGVKVVKITYDMVKDLLLEVRKLSVLDVMVKFKVSSRTARDYLIAVCYELKGTFRNNECVLK